ncbi:phosphotransferase [Actinoplanes sp. KI2]|uniref:phosphotransferase n=1 Tax=Actinoplanes sp. KI2 TaxID=2983315 RepID=UPI0021D5E4DD|nr:phosphotransferase [Actinoplanes sp. KI2]MCU7725465.1 phosphotransferase [Actinoplanes sp. KI2]
MEWVRIAGALGLGRVHDCQAVTSGVMNLSWRLTTDAGTFAVKQLRDRTPDEIRVVNDLLPRLAGAGFPVPTPRGDPVQVDGSWYAATAWLHGVHPEDATLRDDLGELVGRLHVALATLCPPAPRRLADVPESAFKAIKTLGVYADRPPADDFDRSAAREIEWRRAMLAELADQRPADAELAPCGWTHGDLQPFNLLVDADGRVCGILDWDRLGVRPYGLEVVRTATIVYGHSLDRIAAFVRAYRAHVPITDAQLVDAADRRWWTLLTETWQLERHYEHDDRSCDHLLARRGDYLRWWTAHRGEMTEALTAG